MSPLSIFAYVSTLPYIIKVLMMPYQHLRLTRRLNPLPITCAFMFECGFNALTRANGYSKQKSAFIDWRTVDRLAVWRQFRECRLRGGPVWWNGPRDRELYRGLWTTGTINQQRQCRIPVPVWNSNWTGNVTPFEKEKFLRNVINSASKDFPELAFTLGFTEMVSNIPILTIMQRNLFCHPPFGFTSRVQITMQYKNYKVHILMRLWKEGAPSYS